MGDELTTNGSIIPTETDKYSPTPAEVRILEVSLNPEHAGKNVTEKCRVAKVSRDTWYEAFKSPIWNLANEHQLTLSGWFR